MKEQSDVPEVVLLVKNCGKISQRGAKNVQKWLIRQGEFILKEHGNLTRRFRASISGGGLEYRKKGEK